MKYKPLYYTEALYESLKDKSPKQHITLIKNFLDLLKKNHDYHLLNSIVVRYEKISLARQGLRKVEVETVSTLTPELRKKIEEILGTNILLDQKINPEIIGGMTIVIDTTLRIDASARTIINTLLP